MTEQLFIFMLLIHWLADFALQTHKQATLKSSDNKYLTYHVGTYSLVWLLANTTIMSFSDSLAFASITAVAHFITDYFTSRINKSLFDKKDFHNGFVSIGFDQILHYLQLYFTYKLIYSS